jgi:hypothetical protein
MHVVRIGLCTLAALAVVVGHTAAQERSGGLDWSLLRTPDYAGAYTKGYELGQRLAADRAAARDKQRREDRARAVGRLIAANRCDDARAYALGEGDLELAGRVSAYCTGK